jgi:hypothetical protein
MDIYIHAFVHCPSGQPAVLCIDMPFVPPIGTVISVSASLLDPCSIEDREFISGYGEIEIRVTGYTMDFNSFVADGDIVFDDTGFCVDAVLVDPDGSIVLQRMKEDLDS